MSANPWAEVAVKALAPAEAAPMQQAMAECSDSTRTKSPFSHPVAQKSAKASTIVVCGEMGYAGTTCTRESMAP
jgi:hypothetical protein